LLSKPTLVAGIFLTVALTTQLCSQQPPANLPPDPTAAGLRASLPGAYDGGQMEVAAQLLLRPDGHFQYELAYGALDEVAQGTWEVHYGAVYLTTVPAVVPPRFVVVSDTPEARAGLWIKLSNPIRDGGRQRVDLFYPPNPDGTPSEPDMAEVADDGSVPIPAGRKPISFAPEIPVYPIAPKPIPLSGTGGHRITLRFEPNDIGKADFNHMRLGIEDGVLVMSRRDLQLILHFKPQPK
jgi:hypothetical protein